MALMRLDYELDYYWWIGQRHIATLPAVEWNEMYPRDSADAW